MLTYGALCELAARHGVTITENVRAFVREVEQTDAAQTTAEPIAWESTTPFYRKYLTQSGYERIGEQFRKWYKPYRCSSCENPAPAPNIKSMVDRFLGWRLPDDFGPDCGITFTPLDHPNGWPVGTNLFTADQARAMFEYAVSPAAAQQAEHVGQACGDSVEHVGIDPVELTQELYRAHVLKVLAEIEAIARDRTDAHWAGFQNAIEEVRTRLDMPAEQQAEPHAKWEDPRVQQVYEILCRDDAPPAGEHWEGFQARLIVDALFGQQAAVAEKSDFATFYVPLGWHSGREGLIGKHGIDRDFVRQALYLGAPAVEIYEGRRHVFVSVAAFEAWMRDHAATQQRDKPINSFDFNAIAKACRGEFDESGGMYFDRKAWGFFVYDLQEALSGRRPFLADKPWDAAAHDVLAERTRQITHEGATPIQDDGYTEGELALAAACYAMASSGYAKGQTPPLWPWHVRWWKPSYGRRDLVKAGALILAEIERLDRAAATQQEALK